MLTVHSSRRLLVSLINPPLTTTSANSTTATMVTHGAVSAIGPEARRGLIVVDFTHDMARSRAFRWGEDGIAGISDSHGLQNIGFAFWNEKE